MPKTSGILNTRIFLKKNLKSLDGFFKDNKELIKVNLTNLIMNEVTSMKSTFSGCSNLIEINFEGINSGNLMKMENTFENCIELKNINLSPLNTSNLLYMNNMFSGCQKLETINLTSFEKINYDLFNGIKSKPNIIANQLISNDIKNIFKNLFSVDINITIIIIEHDDKCEIGNEEKCKSCSTIIKSNCLTCNEGYYLPNYEIDNRVCLPCNVITNCMSCIGEKNNIVCSSCKTGYNLIGNTCEKIKKEIQECTIGKGEKCKKCNDTLKNQCQSCNKGYFLPEDENKFKCEKCDLNGCIQCSGTKDNKKCLKCKKGFQLINEKCIKGKCMIGDNEKCATCRTEEGREKECQTCNEGYYTKENNNSFTCFKCTIEDCKQCYFYLNQEYCQECNPNFEASKNTNGLIENCICPLTHKNYKGLCIEKGNWIEIEYNVTNCSTKNQIMNTLYTGIELNEIDMYINNSIVPLTKENDWDKGIFCQFEKNGVYKIKINIKKTLYSMSWMFTNLRKIKSIKFLPGFDSSKVTSMNNMFAFTSVETIDVKYLDTSELLDLSDFLEASYSITSIDLSNFDTTKTKKMRGMFNDNRNLKEIDLSSFYTSNVDDCLIMFHDIPINCTIKISNKFTKCKEQIPYYNKIINIDDIACSNFANCEKCSGSKESLKCIKCKNGYQLADDKCITQKCEFGENEKCLSCNNIIGKEDECLECNEGYYLTSNILNKNICSKCNLDGCKSCDKSGNCQECKNYYSSTIDQKTGKIINCNELCELGKNNKCLTCNEKIGYESQCGSCNEGYKLVNGKCKIIENSFIGIYNVRSIDNFTYIMNLDQNNIKLSDFDMYVNGTKVYPYIEHRYSHWLDDDYVVYKFPNLGKYEVKIIFNKTLTDMKYLFAHCYDLISIEFNEAFDTSHVLSMHYMFASCDSLEKINVSSFNTSLVGRMDGMFSSLDSLTSLDLSNFDTKNVDFMQCMFSNSKQLNYLDISSFDFTNIAGTACVFDNIAPIGTIIVNKKFNDLSSLPENWTIIYKDY